MRRRPEPATKASDSHRCASGSTQPGSDVEDALSGLLTEPIRSSLLADVLRQIPRGSLSLSRSLVVRLPPQRVAGAIDETKAMTRCEPCEPVHEEAREGLLDLSRMAQHDV